MWKNKHDNRGIVLIYDINVKHDNRGIVMEVFKLLMRVMQRIEAVLQVHYRYCKLMHMSGNTCSVLQENMNLILGS